MYTINSGHIGTYLYKCVYVQQRRMGDISQCWKEKPRLEFREKRRSRATIQLRLSAIIGGDRWRSRQGDRIHHFESQYIRVSIYTCNLCPRKVPLLFGIRLKTQRNFMLHIPRAFLQLIKFYCNTKSRSYRWKNPPGKTDLKDFKTSVRLSWIRKSPWKKKKTRARNSSTIRHVLITVNNVSQMLRVKGHTVSMVSLWSQDICWPSKFIRTEKFYDAALKRLAERYKSSGTFEECVLHARWGWI